MANHRTAKDYAYLSFTGVAMGAADVVPGVSGGTMAFILGIYEELISAIKSFDLALLGKLARGDLRGAFAQIPWRFLIALGSGLVASVLTLAHAVSWLLEHKQTQLYALFFGLVLASIVTVAGQVRWNGSRFAALALSSLFAWWLVGLVPSEGSHGALTLFASGAVAISAMILPGISGSFILLILGQYAFVLTAIKELDVVTLIPFALGCGLGLAAFARVLGWLFAHHRNLTITLLVGFMLGSLRKIWPFKEVVETRIDRHGDEVPVIERNLLPDFSATETWIAVGLFVAGFVAIMLLNRLRQKLEAGRGEMGKTSA